LRVIIAIAFALSFSLVGCTGMESQKEPVILSLAQIELVIFGKESISSETDILENFLWVLDHSNWKDTRGILIEAPRSNHLEYAFVLKVGRDRTLKSAAGKRITYNQLYLEYSGAGQYVLVSPSRGEHNNNKLYEVELPEGFNPRDVRLIDLMPN